MSGERREFARKPMTGPARLTIQGQAPFMVRIRDISLGGLSVVADINVPLGQVMRIEFNIVVRKSGRFTSISTLGRLSYTAFSQSENGFKAGLQFTALADNDRQLILQYIEVLLAK